jgi:serine phosphatase RsbU (regulator of sigma subunit)/Tfp pilus assembly protein PilF
MEEIESVSSGKIDNLNQTAWDVRRSDLRTSWKLANDVERLSIASSYQKGLAESLRTLGYCLWRFGDYSQSLEKSLFALNIFRSMNEKRGEADTLNSIGAVYMYQGDHENRLKCNQLCLQLRTEINDAEGVAASENNIGETYMEMGNLGEAEKWLTKCLNNQNASVQIRSWAYHNFGIIYSRKKQYEKAFSSYNKSLELSASVNYEVLSVSTHLHIAQAMIQSGVFSEEVESHLNQALETSIRIGIKEEIHNVYLTLSELEERRGDISKSFDWFKKYHKAYEDLFNDSSNQKIKNIQTQYEIETSRKEIEYERKKHLELKRYMEQINAQKNEITQKNREITDSIMYASRIQLAALTSQEYIKKNLPFDFFIFYKPKDIVSGDFYWATKKNDKFYIAVCDSTGHGVPGAFMSLLNISYLNEAINEKNITEPNLVLDYVRERLIANLSQEEQQDGMDGVLLCINYSTLKITYAASYNAPVIVRENNVLKLPADKMPIGKGIKTELFKSYDLDCLKGDIVYLYTDGFADQFGLSAEAWAKTVRASYTRGSEVKGKKFKYKQLREKMRENASAPLDQQSEKFNRSFEAWQGDLEQVDDVTIVGFKIS